MFFSYSAAIAQSAVQASAVEDTYNFVENRGQFHPNVKYKAALPGGNVYVEQNRWTFQFIERPEHSHKNDHLANGHNHAHEELREKEHVYRLNFKGSQKNNFFEPSVQKAFHHNYFLGNDQSKWAGNVPVYGKISQRELYDCIDLEVYTQDKSFKYDFIVHPGGDPEKIVLEYEGVDEIFLKKKNLYIKTSVNEVYEMRPYAYQIINGKTKKVDCEFALDGNVLTFDLPKKYNKNATLIIDPTLIFASYSNSAIDNWGYTATYDDDGNLYGGGIVFGAGYPIQTGAYDAAFNGGSCDIGISKFSSNGSTLLYSTYIGGLGSELPHSLIVNNAGQLVILGTTSSSNYPTTSGAWDDSFGGGPAVPLSVDGDGGVPYLNFSAGADIIISILSPDGSSLDGSTYFGGNLTDGLNTSGINSLQVNYGDHARGEVIVDANDNIYIASSIGSTPNTIGQVSAIQASLGSQQDGLVARFNSNVTSLDWYTFLGGNKNDAAYSLKIHPNGRLYVAGGTRSENMPGMNGLNTSYLGGQADGYLISMWANGTGFVHGTFLGTGDYDQAYFVEIDENNDIYTVGQTAGLYSVVGNVWSNNNGRQFIHKLNPTLNATEWSTTFGSGSKINISPTAFLVDKCGRVYVSGWGGTVNGQSTLMGNTNGLTVTPDAYQSSTDGSDLYFFVLEKDASELLYATFFGANNSNAGEHVDGGTSRFDKEGIIYQAVCAGCGGTDAFPTTPGAWSNSNGSNNCNLAVVKFNFEPNIIEALADIAPRATGCAPFEVGFTTSTEAEEYIWDFGDGSALSNEMNPTHVFGVIDTYTVTLVVIDSLTCNIADTTTTTVFIPDSTKFFDPFADPILPPLCDPYIVDFTNASDFDPSVATIESFSYVWDFGDGETSTETSPIHEYAEHGTYDISLTMIQEPCPGEKVFQMEIFIEENPIVSAEFLAPDKACIPLPVVLEAEDEAETYIWNMGNGEIFEVEDPVFEYVYEEKGTYEIILIAVDSTTCNLRDTSSVTMEVFDAPTAYFTFDQPAPYILVDVEFTNLSTPDTLLYLWNFGDGDTSIERNPIHSYLQVGDNEVCLTVTHPEGGCTDTYCEIINISADFKFLIPTAFTPNNDGLNDEYVIRGFGVENFKFLIFNRWGEKVFESNKFGDKWDGWFRKKEQDIGVFVYYIEARVAGGKEFLQKGNITLIK